MAGDLLKALADRKVSSNIEDIDNNITLAMNTNSGCVFLSDDEYRTFMMNDGVLDEWAYCSTCGSENFVDDLFDGDCTNKETCKHCN
ncbi:MAG: hypothetical protein ACRBBN_06820 [Methyloligellaceae bacterium]